METEDLQFTEEELEELEKAAHYWKDKNPAKYKKMLAKLRRERKTPGHKERAYQAVLQAKRREKGAPGTKTGGHKSGHMKSDTGSAAKRFQNAEKKAGTKLSPDRKDNEKGYASGNVRNVPQKLNRGRHHVDPKKLKAWKKRLKKSGIDMDDFVTLLRAKSLEKNNEQLCNLLTIIDIERFIDNLE